MSNSEELNTVAATAASPREVARPAPAFQRPQKLGIRGETEEQCSARRAATLDTPKIPASKLAGNKAKAASLLALVQARVGCKLGVA